MGLISRVSSRTYRYFYTFEDTSYFVENFKKCLNSVPKPSNDSLNAELPNEKPSKDSMEFAELWKSEQPLLFSWPAMSKKTSTPNSLKLWPEANVPLMKVDSGKTLGQMVGLCKYDEEGEPRKVVGCGCVVLKDWPVTAGDAVEQFKAAL